MFLLIIKKAKFISGKDFKIEPHIKFISNFIKDLLSKLYENEAVPVPGAAFPIKIVSGSGTINCTCT